MSQKITIKFEDTLGDEHSCSFTSFYEKQDIVFDEGFYTWLINTFESMGCSSVSKTLKNCLDTPN